MPDRAISLLQRLLFGLVAGLVALDVAWGFLGGFRVDVATYLPLGALGMALLAGGVFYQTRRPDPRIAVLLFGASFLVLFSAAANLLNNYLLTVAGTRIDALLDRMDRALGFDWYRLMLAMAEHPRINQALFTVYNSTLPEIALLLVLLASAGLVERAYRMCLAVALGALMAIGLWALHPAFGAMSLYVLPPGVMDRLVLSLTPEFGHAQVALLDRGPGFITPDALHGSLIGFPSYHTVLALILGWHAWRLRVARWPLLALNLLVIVSTPVQGGHHLMDVLAAFPVAALALLLAGRVTGAEAAHENRAMVNKRPRFTIRPVPQGLFRIVAAQVAPPPRKAIKSKLSGFP